MANPEQPCCLIFSWNHVSCPSRPLLPFLLVT